MNKIKKLVFKSSDKTKLEINQIAQIKISTPQETKRDSKSVLGISFGKAKLSDNKSTLIERKKPCHFEITLSNVQKKLENAKFEGPANAKRQKNETPTPLNKYNPGNYKNIIKLVSKSFKSSALSQERTDNQPRKNEIQTDEDEALRNQSFTELQEKNADFSNLTLFSSKFCPKKEFSQRKEMKNKTRAFESEKMRSIQRPLKVSEIMNNIQTSKEQIGGDLISVDLNSKIPNNDKIEILNDFKIAIKNEINTKNWLNEKHKKSMVLEEVKLAITQSNLFGFDSSNHSRKQIDETSIIKIIFEGVRGK